MENDVLRQLTLSTRAKKHQAGIVPVPTGYQDMGGRVTRYPMRSSEKTEAGSSATSARLPLDGRHGRRLFLPVPDRHAQYRPAPAEGNGGLA